VSAGEGDISPFELEWRSLTADDSAWLTFFDAGPDWWSDEVTGFLRQHALDNAKSGYSSTLLFSFPEEKHVAGFVAFASSSLKLAKLQGGYPKFGPPPGVETPNVPVWVVPYFGVHGDFQGRGLGEEMHVQLLRLMDSTLGAPRFLYLQCWEENARGVDFWIRLHYQEFDRTTEQHLGAQHRLVWLVLDRFSITEPE
jgi:ribosomal protein S18 acetylase RimI-like enzyme